jgi:hypothetical protein
MRRFPGFALLVAVGWGLGACASAPPANTAQARCEQQVYDDPAYKAVLVDASTYNIDPRFQERLAQARRKSIYNCLVAEGLAPPGGVQPVSRARYGLGWFNTD